MPVMIRMLEEEIRKNIKESERAVVAIEKYVQNINDPKVRELMRSRFIDCLSWEEVGAQNFINADYARQLINKHIKQILKICAITFASVGIISKNKSSPFFSDFFMV